MKPLPFEKSLIHPLFLNSMKRGTTVLRCDPFCHIVKEDRRATVCDNCFAEANEDEAEVPLKKCTRCKVAWYCGVGCQESTNSSLLLYKNIL